VGHPPWPPGQGPISEHHTITPDYFATLGIPVTRGRTLSSGDQATAPPVVLVNETLAEKIFGRENPLGQRLKFGDDTFEIVGVAADVRRFGKTRESVPETYFSLWQQRRSSMSVA